jgi:hypothetical protein
VIAVVCAAVATGAVVLSRRGDDSPSVAAADLRWLLADPPAGWEAYGALDTLQAGTPDYWADVGHYRMALYGTHDDPAAPTVILAFGEEMNADGFLALNGIPDIQRFDAKGRTVGCGTYFTGWQLCFVQVGDAVVQAHARGLPADELATLLTSTTADHGAPRLSSSSLPARMRELATWEDRLPAPISTIVPTATATTVLYVGPDGSGATMTVGRAAEQDLAGSFELADFERVQDGGMTYFVGDDSSVGTRAVVWERAEYAYVLVVGGDADPLALARTVRPATAAEWAAAITNQPAPPAARPVPPKVSTTVSPNPSATVATTLSTTLSTTPLTTTPSPLPSVITDVPLTPVVEPVPGGAGATFSTPLPDGTFGTLTLIALPGVVLTSFDGTPTGGETLTDSLVLSPLMGVQSSGAYVISTEGRATILRVTRTNGERYLVPLTPHLDDPGVMVAYIALPQNQTERIDVVDGFGVVLDHIG